MTSTQLGYTDLADVIGLYPELTIPRRVDIDPDSPLTELVDRVAEEIRDLTDPAGVGPITWDRSVEAAESWVERAIK